MADFGTNMIKFHNATALAAVSTQPINFFSKESLADAPKQQNKIGNYKTAVAAIHMSRRQKKFRCVIVSPFN